MSEDAPTVASIRARAAARDAPPARTAQPALARQLGLSVEHQLPSIIEGWKSHLQDGEVTDEMVDCFVALGWLSSRQDPRLSPRPTPPRG